MYLEMLGVIQRVVVLGWTCGVERKKNWSIKLT